MRKQIVTMLLVVSLTGNVFMLVYAVYQKAQAERAVENAQELRKQADNLSEIVMRHRQQSEEALKACESRITTLSNSK